VEAEVNSNTYPDRSDLSRGSVIFSDFPIDTNLEAVTVDDVTFTNKVILAEDTPEVEGRAFGRVTININGFDTDVWFGFNDSTLVMERALIPYVKAAAEPEDQMNMLDLRAQQVQMALEAITVETLTPIEAMNELYKLKMLLN
jgi:hypothetical protein